MNAQELQDRIAAFPRWQYRFEFGEGVFTPVRDRGVVNRHEQRRAYFFEPLVRALGGSLHGRRVLDLGCNAGLWSLLALQAGAEFVLGIDGRKMFIEQAELVFAAKRVERERYRFVHANIFEHEFTESFDVVLCLGVLDHTAKPVSLLELIRQVDASVVVIDSEISRARSSVFEVSNLPDPHSVVDIEMVLIPSRLAVIELAAQFGFSAVPLAQNMTDYTGMKDYRDQRRLAFICSRGMILEGLSAESRPLAPWWVTAAVNARKARDGRGASADARRRDAG